MSNNLRSLYLKKHEDRRIRAGHLWIYSNEVDVAKSPLSQFQAGDFVIIKNHQEQVLGTGYINPNTLICARLLSNQTIEKFDHLFFEQRIRQALTLRNALFSQPYYRLIFAESDFLPGLVIDRYNQNYVVQITTAGMERCKSAIITAMQAVLEPQTILWRNDSSVRELEGLPIYVEPALGNPPKKLNIIENNANFQIPIWEGQKTGWFYDHRNNRQALKKYVAGKRVLDLFCYLGAWGIQAAVFNAKEVVCVDSSEFALAQLTINAELNQVSHKVHSLQANAFDQLKQFQQDNEKFDVVIVDPPAFIKRRKDIKEGTIAYLRINELALRLVNENGLLVSSSCSLHLAMPMLHEIIGKASAKLQRFTQIIETGHQSYDHPVHPAIMETNYLKALFCRVN